jgi:hypothetical protein
MTRWSKLWLATFGLALVGCGDGDPPSDDPSTGALLPWSEGNSWTYKVTDSATGTVTRKVTKIMPTEAVSGTGPNKDTLANKVVTSKEDGNDETHSWQALVGDKVVRYREVAFASGAPDLEEHWDPFKLRVDGSPSRAKSGPSWVEKYAETKTKLKSGVVEGPFDRRDTWQVLKEAEKVSVPAGEFDALVVTRASGSDSTKTYYFVRGVGKVKETGANQTEELEDYDLKE